MKKVFLLLMIVAAAATGCQKDISDEVLPTTNPDGSGTYLPLAKDNFWKYRQTGIFAGEYTMQSTGTRRTLGGIEYTVFTGSNAPGAESLMAVKDGKYYARSAGNSPNSGAPFDLTMLFLNDKEDAGFTWQFAAGQGNGFTARCPGKVVERGITMTVDGKSYSDVIHCQIKLQYEMPSPVGLMEALTYDYYAAKNIGIIRIVSEGDPIWAPGVSSVSDLIEYKLK